MYLPEPFLPKIELPQNKLVHFYTREYCKCNTHNFFYHNDNFIIIIQSESLDSITQKNVFKNRWIPYNYDNYIFLIVTNLFKK